MRFDIRHSSFIRHSSSGIRHSGQGRSGLILLEVVLAVTLFVLGVAMVGASIRGSLTGSTRMAQRTRALALAQSVLAQIRSGYLTAADNAAGDFKPQFENYTYTLAVSDLADSTSVAGLRQITVTVNWLTSPETNSTASDSLSLTGWQYLSPAQQAAAEQGPGGMTNAE